MIEVVCPVCKKLFTARPSQIRSGCGKHCSRICRDNARCTRVTKNCPTCKKKFLVKLSWIARGEGKYCSRICGFAGRKATREWRTCIVCKVLFFIRPCERRKGGKIDYCSRACRNIALSPEIFFMRYISSTPTKKGCLLWLGDIYKATGYGHFFSRRSPHCLAHRFAYALAYGPIPKGLHVLHTCDIPLCVNSQHLFLGTHLENMRDRNNKGRTARGERIASAKLTQKQVLQIRALAKKRTLTYGEIGQRFHTSRDNVSAIVRRRAWKHI